MNERLKQIIFKKLDQDLGHVEIIVDDNTSIWFINRANKYWYLELKKLGHLWWRYQFFEDFFPLFGMEREEYEPVIAEWVEEVLKRGVSSTRYDINMLVNKVEEVLKRGVSSTYASQWKYLFPVEEVLNRKVVSTVWEATSKNWKVEEVLNKKL